MCLCNNCDTKLERELEGWFLNKLCDCDIFTRWIRSKCTKEERTFAQEYYRNHTAVDGNDETKIMGDHQDERSVSSPEY